MKPEVINLSFLGNYTFRLLNDLEFQTESLGKVIVPKGFVTDLASTPRIFWNFFPPHGSCASAAILHDFLYTEGIGSNKLADTAFNEVMKQNNVPKFRRIIVYTTVKLFGRGNFG